MKVKIVFLIVAVTLVFSLVFMGRVNRAETQSPQTVEGKIDLLLKKQDEVLQKLDEIAQELRRIKIRVSRIRNQ